MATAVTGTHFARYDSVWSASVQVPSYPRLDRDLVTDVVVVGAGIAGLSVAYHLFKSGRRVVVLDDGRIGGGITSRTTAHLACAIERLGGRIFAESHADQIVGGKDAHVVTGSYDVATQAIVVATNSPVNDRVFMHTKMAPYMTYVIGARIPASSVPRGLYWDMDDPYHYIRVHTIQPEGEEPREVLIVGGEDHKSGQARDTDRRQARPERWARKRFPMIEEIEFRWAGQVMESVDGLAFIGRNP